MEIEYQRWLMINSILDIYPKSYEYKNIIERLFLNMSNIKNNTGFSVCKILDIDNPIIKIAIHQSLEKKIFYTNLSATNHFKGVIKIINNFIKNKEKFNTSSIGVINKNKIQYKKFSEDFPGNRIKLLKNILSKKGVKDKNNKISQMFLRYMSIGIRGQQWNMPFKNYKYLNDRFNIEIEGFASPINSQLIKISSDKKFCSIFYDTDKYFGSLGNFFDLDISNKSICVNPPYMEPILIKTLDKILELVDNNVRTFTIMPYWEDSKIINIIKDHAVYYEILENKKHYYEDSINNKKIIAKFPSIIAVFEKELSDDYSEIATNMKY